MRRSTAATHTLGIVACGLAIAATWTGLPARAQPRQRIVFASEENGRRGLFALDGDGARRVRLTTAAPESLDAAPAWSPDGCSVAFRRGSAVWIVNAGGGNPARLLDTAGANQQADQRVHFTPDGTRVYSQGMGVAIDSGTPSGALPGRWQSISPDGSGILFATEHGLAVIRAEEIAPALEDEDRGAAARLLWTEASHPGDQVAERAVWSPDGSTIAFVLVHTERRPTATSDLMTIGANGENLRQLTDGSVIVQRLSWSPDGSKIAFESVGERPPLRLEVIHADGAGRRVVAEDPMASLFDLGAWSRVSWSPDGARIAFTRQTVGAKREDHALDVYTVAADGSDLRRLTFDGKSFDPAWAPRPCSTGPPPPPLESGSR